MNLGTLAAIMQGLSEGGENIGTGLALKMMMEEEAAKKKEAAERERGQLSIFHGENQKGIGNKLLDSILLFSGDKGVALGDYENLTEKREQERSLVERYLKMYGYKQTEKTRKEAKNYLKTLPLPKLMQVFGVEPPTATNLNDTLQNAAQETTKEAAPSKSLGQRLSGDWEEFKQFYKDQDYTSPQAYKNILKEVTQTPRNLLGTALKTPYRLGGLAAELGYSLLKNPMKLMGKDPQKLRDVIDKVGEKIDYSGTIDRAIGSQTDYTGQGIAELATDIALPFGKVFKGIGLGSKAGQPIKNVLRGATRGGAESALFSGGDPQSTITGAGIGGGLSGIGEALQSKGRQNLFNKVKADSTRHPENPDTTHFNNKERLRTIGNIMGEKATLPEIAGSTTWINKLKKDTSKTNKDRMQGVLAHMNKQARKLSLDLTAGLQDEQSLYKNLGEMQKNMREQSHALFGRVKDSSTLGADGLLSKNVISKWIRAIEEVEPEIQKNLPRYKPKGVLTHLKNLLLSAPDDPKAYRKFVLDNIKDFPTTDHLLTYYSDIKKTIASGPGKISGREMQELKVLEKSLDNIFEVAGENHNLQKAREFYRNNVSPFFKDKVEGAISGAEFPKGSEGRPLVSDIFSKQQSKEMSQIFEMLPTKDKKVVLGRFLAGIQEGAEKDPSRQMMALWKELPEYIKRTNDKEIRNILIKLDAFAHLNETQSSLQRAVTPDIGSREGLKKFVRPSLYIGSMLGGNPSITATLGGVDLIQRGARKGYHKALRKKLSSGQLEQFLDPQVLKEVQKPKPAITSAERVAPKLFR